MNSDVNRCTEEGFFKRRFHIDLVHAEINRFRNAYKHLVVLSDIDIPIDIDSIRCDIQRPDALGEYNMKETMFIYACDFDDLGMPFIDYIVKAGGKFSPVHSYLPSLYCNIRKSAMDALLAEYKRQKEEGYLKWGVGSFFGRDQLNLFQAIDLTAGLEGDFVEIGCFRGSTARVALRYMALNGIQRKCYFLDVFDGFNYESAKKSADSVWAGTHETEGEDIVRNRIVDAAKGSPGLKVQVIRNNIIEDEFPEPIGDLCLASIDVDMYEAVYEALLKVYKRIVKNGIIVVEDPGHSPALIGARLALESFLDEHGESFTPVYLESGQTFLIKS